MVDISAVKLYLRIDGDSEDGLLERFIEIADSNIRDAVDDYDAKCTLANFNAKAEMLQLLMVQDLYENRNLYNTENAKDFSYAVRSMLEQLRYAGGGQL